MDTYITTHLENTVHVRSVHTQGRIVATFPLNGYPADSYRIYLESADTPGVNDTDRDRYVVLDNRGYPQRYHGGLWFPTFRSALRRAVAGCGWGDLFGDMVD